MARPNPYAPPVHDEDAAPVSDHGRDYRPASRGVRFLGAFIDGIVMIVAGFLGRALGGVQPELGKLNATEIACSLAVMGVQGLLVARSGQSIGKLLMRTRIVLEDGRPPGVWRGYVLRTMPPTLVYWAATPFAGPSGALGLAFLVGLYGIVDVLLIFGSDHRCSTT